ncbi:hypothetical protein Pcinc_030787 [Petrolisthes cinctipes]|uniref:Uncharacterized protein n=1 Tax=Petrolisthes cinctipes TaxID=88211 RepID=A0AAE1EXQ0_PETCI|nr:hypothetical protein Pcinc_030787 [Petrolisthes cinctipes]
MVIKRVRCDGDSEMRQISRGPPGRPRTWARLCGGLTLWGRGGGGGGGGGGMESARVEIVEGILITVVWKILRKSGPRPTTDQHKLKKVLPPTR